MSYGQYLRELLAPLGVYRWEGSFQWGELQSEGALLDQVAGHLAETRREMLLATARDQGLTGLQELLGCRPGARDTGELRLALAALLRIDGNSFTPAAIEDTLRGCGIPARAEETDLPCHLVVTFPETGGVPENFEELRRIIEEILPCHVWVEYQFRYLTWEELEVRFPTWEVLEGEALSWQSFEAQGV